MKKERCSLCNVVLDPEVDTIYVDNDLGDIVCDSCIYEFTSWSESLGTYYDTESKEVYFRLGEEKGEKKMKYPIIKIDTKGNVTQLNFDLKNGLAQAYREIECNTIDIITVYIDGVAVDIIVDDEGLMKDNPVPTVAISKERQLFGNVLLVPSDVDDEGNYHRGFTAREIVVIQNNIREFIDFRNGLIRKVLVVF